MSKIILLLFFVGIVILGFAAIKNLDVFFAKNVQRNSDIKGEENTIRIACENPFMLSSVSEKLEIFSKECKEISFHFLTGDRKDIQKMLENGTVDFAILMEDMNIEDTESYGKKISSFFPSPLSEAMTGLLIEPIEKQQMNMYVLWKKTYITEKQRMLIPFI